MYINIILAFSNFIGIYIVYKNIKYRKKFVYNCFLIAVICASFLHHLTETNQVNHKLRDKIHWIDNYGDYLRYIDMILAYTFFVYIVWTIGVHDTIKFIKNNYIILFIALLCSFLCDFIITDQKQMYLILHLTWHILIYFLLYKISFILQPC